jgi:hypothetical protein
MIWQLMKRDPAFRWLPQLTLAFSAFCALWPIFAPMSRNADEFGALAFAVILFRAQFAVTERQDDKSFQAFLPISSRQVFLSRMLSMFVLLWLPVLVGAAVMTLHQDREVSPFLLELWSVFTFIFLGLQSAVIRGSEFFRRWVNMVPVFLWLGCSDALPAFSVSVVTKMLLLAGCWLIGIVIVWRAWQAIPKVFQDKTPMQSPATTRIADSKWISAPSSPKTLFRMIFQLRGTAIFVVFFLMLFGTANATWCMIVAFQWLTIRSQMHWLMALPVSPRALVAVAILPMLIALTGGYLVSIHLPWIPAPVTRGLSVRHAQQLFERHLLSSEDSGCETPNVLPSLEYWIPVKSGRAPLIRSPWGETFQPSAYRESGFVVYNPYAVGCGNSRRFLEWQFTKATVAIFGRPIPLDKNVDPYVEQTPVTKGGRQLVDIAAITGFSMLTMLIAMVFDWRRFRALPNWLRFAILSLVGVSAGGLFLLMVTFKLDVTQWIAWTLPANPAGMIAASLIVLVSLYLAIERLFRELEFVDKPPRPRA